MNHKQKIWRDMFESKGFNLCKSKTQNVECKFNDKVEDSVVEVRLGMQTTQKKNGFKYLGSMVIILSNSIY